MRQVVQMNKMEKVSQVPSFISHFYLPAATCEKAPSRLSTLSLFLLRDDIEFRLHFTKPDLSLNSSLLTSQHQHQYPSYFPTNLHIHATCLPMTLHYLTTTKKQKSRSQVYNQPSRISQLCKRATKLCNNPQIRRARLENPLVAYHFL